MVTTEVIIEKDIFDIVSDLDYENITIDNWYLILIKINVEKSESNTIMIQNEDIEQIGQLLSFATIDIDHKQNIEKNLCLDYFDDLPNHEEMRMFVEERLQNLTLNTFGVGFLPVGKGSSIAFVNKFLQPLAFFDVGGSLKRSADDYKSCILNYYEILKGTWDFSVVLSHWHRHHWKHTIDEKQHPFVFLSHWHKDHWEQATRSCGEGLKESQWIAPNQTLKPTAAKLAKHLSDNGKLIVWQKKWGEIVGHEFNAALVKCTGVSINDSGLAMIGKVFEEMSYLFPGDAAYKHIPNCRKNDYNLLAASHHGGRLTSWKVIPKPVKNQESIITYSYKKGGKHPFSDSIDAHASVGWSSSYGISEYRENNKSNIHSFEEFRYEINVLTSLRRAKRYDVTDCNLGLFICDCRAEWNNRAFFSRRFLSINHENWPTSYFYFWGSKSN